MIRVSVGVNSKSVPIGRIATANRRADITSEAKDTKFLLTNKGRNKADGSAFGLFALESGIDNANK